MHVDAALSILGQGRVLRSAVGIQRHVSDVLDIPALPIGKSSDLGVLVVASERSILSHDGV